MYRAFFAIAAVCFLASCVVIKINSDLIEVRTSEFEMQPGSELNFSNSNGDLEVTEWESDYILIETSIYGDSSTGVPSGLEIKLEELEDRLDVSVDYPSNSFCSSVDFSVKIPEEMEYTINQICTNGETLIIAAVVANVESTNGDIQVEVLSSSSIQTTNGDISAILQRQNDSVTIETTNGDIEVEISDLIGIEAGTVNGDIVIDGVEKDNDVFIDGDRVAIISTTNGDIQINRSGAL